MDRALCTNYIGKRASRIESRSADNTSQADLAPTKQRIATVRNWLEEAITGVPASVRESGVSFSEGAKEQVRRYRVGRALGRGKSRSLCGGSVSSC